MGSSRHGQGIICPNWNLEVYCLLINVGASVAHPTLVRYWQSRQTRPVVLLAMEPWGTCPWNSRIYTHFVTVACQIPAAPFIATVTTELTHLAIRFKSLHTATAAVLFANTTVTSVCLILSRSSMSLFEIQDVH